MNILLLYPEFPDTFWSFKHALRFVRKKASCAAPRSADRRRDDPRRLGQTPCR